MGAEGVRKHLKLFYCRNFQWYRNVERCPCPFLVSQRTGGLVRIKASKAMPQKMAVWGRDMLISLVQLFHITQLDHSITLRPASLYNYECIYSNQQSKFMG